MAIGAIFSKARKPGVTIIGDLEIPVDITESHVHNLGNTITSNPVEDGSDITDHIIKNPDMITVTGKFTDHPIAYFAGLVDILTEGLGAEARSKTAFNKLRQLSADGSIVTLRTSLYTYSNMAIESLAVTKDRATGNAISFSATFKQIEIVSSKEITLDEAKLRDDIKDNGAARVDVGKQVATTPSASDTENVSILYSLIN